MPVKLLGAARALTAAALCLAAAPAAAPASALNPVIDIAPGSPVASATGPDGTQVVILRDGPLKAAVRAPGGAWDVPVVIAEGGDLPDGRAKPKVAVDRVGNITVAWAQTQRIVEVTRSDGVWKQPRGIFNAPALGDKQFETDFDSGFDLAVAPSGRGVIAFTARRPHDTAGCADGDTFCQADQYNARVAVRGLTGDWTSPRIVSSQTDRSHFSSGLAAGVDDAGRATVAWEQYVSVLNASGSVCGSNVMRSARVAPDGTFTTRAISDGPCYVHDADAPDVAVDPTGRRVVTWGQLDRCDDPCDEQSLRVSYAGPTAALPLGTSLHEFDRVQAAPAAAINASGHVAVAMSEGMSPSEQVLVTASRTPLDGWAVDGDAGRVAIGRPTVSVGPDGTAMAAYLDSNRVDSNTPATTYYTMAAMHKPGAASWGTQAWATHPWDGGFMPGEDWWPTAGALPDGSFSSIWGTDGTTVQRTSIPPAKVSTDGTTIALATSGVEANRLTVDRVGTGAGAMYRFRDPATELETSGACLSVNPTEVRCPVGSVARITVRTGAGNDTVALRLPAGDPASASGYAGPGNDVLTGGADVDALYGDAGADRLDGGAGGDRLDGGTDTDSITYAARTTRVAVRLDGYRNDGADTDGSGLSTSAEEGDIDIAIETVIGGTAGDRLTGGPGANLIRGGAGDDLLAGGYGRDSIYGDLGSDTMSYAGRPSTEPVTVKLDGVRNDGAAGESDYDSGIENATGGAGPDVLQALRAEVNVLDGRAGDDLLRTADGTTAIDRLLCGVGADRFSADPSDSRSSCETAVR